MSNIPRNLKAREAQKKYRSTAEYKERHRLQEIERRKKNPEKYRQASAKWRKTNPEKYKEAKRISISRRRQNKKAYFYKIMKVIQKLEKMKRSRERRYYEADRACKIYLLKLYTKHWL